MRTKSAHVVPQSPHDIGLFGFHGGLTTPSSDQLRMPYFEVI